MLYKYIISFTALIFFVLSMVVPAVYSQTNHLYLSDAKLKNLQRLKKTHQDKFKLRLDTSNHTPSLIKLKPAVIKRGKGTVTLSSLNSIAKQFISDNRDILGLKNPEKEIRLSKGWVDNLGTKHFKYQQVINNIPVWGKEVSVHMDAEDSVYLFKGRYEQTPDQTLTTAPSVTSEEASGYAVSHMGIDTDKATIKNDGLYYYKTINDTFILTYRLELKSSIAGWIYFINAENGEFIHRISLVHRDVVTATGDDLEGTKQTFNAWNSGEADNPYYLIDTTFPGPAGSDDPIDLFENGNVYIWDALNEDFESSSSLTLFYIKSNTLNSGWDPAGVSAIHHIKTIHDYYKDTYNRNGINDANMDYEIVVNYGTGDEADNAFWYDSTLYIGSGDVNYSNFAESLDVMAHETQHGITEHTTNLVYQGQSGALNESFSDIFACMIDRKNWLLGEGITINDPFYLRSLSNPESGLDPQPSKMSDYLVINPPYNELNDYGGVHTNSGIPNKAAYLMADGLTMLSLGTSIGREKTEQIFYRALTTYLLVSSDFLDARDATVLAAEDFIAAGDSITSEVYTQDDVDAVNAAWDAVEVTSNDSGDGGDGGDGYQPPDSDSGDEEQTPAPSPSKWNDSGGGGGGCLISSLNR